ncbi:MAG: UDP-N-acetylmuramoyl-L-alanyl-D-glutamate--2,6-diaminopimelate ligase [Burkholderiales bacterium]|nr:UDP-N-acetylmuramoyl-L-alanyl-D-glutamate--2,6-diaminopimelate ligase [Burkholderiales bacterium]
MTTFDLQRLNSRLRELGAAPHSLATDSRRVRPGDTFIACPGEVNDGRAFIGKAIAAGAIAVLWESGDGFVWDTAWRVPQLGIAGLRRHLGEIAAQVYGDPSQQMRTIGVTGTNGKTTCSHWIAQALNRLGRKTAVIGTLGAGFPGGLSVGTHTTPDAVALQKLFAEYRRQGAECVAMEVSSHGLAQYRLNGIAFDTALFTNLTRDHLDYHGDMQTYAAAKAELFRWPGLRHAVINLDDYYGAAIAAEVSRSGVELLGYGFGDAGLAARNLQLTAQGLTFDVVSPVGEARLQSRALGRFNAANLLGALGVLLTGGVALNDAVSALAGVEPVAGRLQMLGGGNRPLVVVDFAHTPDALGKALATLRELINDQTTACGEQRSDKAQTRKLICVFGCGGDRDRGKRPIMAEVATRLADQVIVTSDNPRFEKPCAIIDEIMAGAGVSAVQVFEDRAVAIAEAIHTAHCGDIVLIAGKGHEEYQEINGVRLPFSDVAAARRGLGGREPHVCHGASN